MGVTLQEDKHLMPEKNLTELEKGLDSHSPSLSTLPSLQLLNEKQFDHDNKNLDKEPLLSENGRKPMAPLAEPETPGNDLVAENRFKDVNKTDKHEEPGFELAEFSGDGRETPRPLESHSKQGDVDQLDGIVPQRDGALITQEAPAPDPSNWYQMNKNLAQGMMDLALLSANANQLRYVLDSANTHPFYYASLIFISLSIFFQVAVGIGLILSSRYDLKLVNEEEHLEVAHKINNWTVGGVFLVTILNVFITAFSVSSNTNVPVQVKQTV